MKLSEISRTLQEIRVAPVKTLGQNFLHDQNLARWIVEQAGILPNEFVMEIGPGLGALTQPALEQGAKILAIEKDARLADFLREKFRDERCEILHGDALKFDPRNLFARGPTKLLGNLPYYAATELLWRFLKSPSPISSALLMLQREVAARLAAAPGGKDYGVPSVLTQAQWRVELLRAISPGVFLPAPEVDSALVRLTQRRPDEQPAYDFETLRLLVRRGFSQRRKQVAKLLKDFFPDWNAVAKEIDAVAQSRAEELSLAQWIGLTNLLAPPISKSEGNDPAEMFAVVDANDQVIGAKSRAEVHGNNLRHRATHIFLFNRAGELLLQKRSAQKDRHPNLWDSSAAGHVSAGESYDETAARELAEELGVIAPPRRVLQLPASAQTGEEFIWLYRGECAGPFKPDRSEISAVEFFPPDLINRWIEQRPGDFAPGFLECWRAFRLTIAHG